MLTRQYNTNDPNRVNDPAYQLLQKIQRAHGQVESTALLLDVYRNELRRVIREGREAGLTLDQIGKLIGVSRQRVAQMVD